MLISELSNHTPKFCINTWKNYNENGAFPIYWVDVPDTEEELQDLMNEFAQKVGEDPKEAEFFVIDSEDILIKYRETNPISLQKELIEILEDVDDEEEKLEAFLESGEEWDSDRFKNACFYKGYSFSDYANELADETLSSFTQSKEIEWLKRFFDYDAHERELEFECNYTETDSGLLIFE